VYTHKCFKSLAAKSVGIASKIKSNQQQQSIVAVQLVTSQLQKSLIVVGMNFSKAFKRVVFDLKPRRRKNSSALGWFHSAIVDISYTGSPFSLLQQSNGDAVQL